MPDRDYAEIAAAVVADCRCACGSGYHRDLCTRCKTRTIGGGRDGRVPFKDHEEPSSSPVVVCMNDVEPESVEWVWPGRIPLAKITVFDGDPGLGTSTVTLEITARVTIGAPMPDGSPGIMGNVVVVSAEDGLADTIRPRLDAAGAVLRKVTALTAIQGSERQYPVTLPEHLPQIESAVLGTEAKLLVLDPLMAFLSPDVNTHRDHDVRRVLHALKEVAERTGAAILIVRHLNKSAGGSPIYRGGGSIGIIGAARSGLLVAKDPDNEELRVLASTKCNLAAQPASLSYRLEPGANGAVRVAWLGSSSHTAQSILAMPEGQGERDAVSQAAEVLGSILADGPLEAKEVRRQARQAGVSDRTIDRAKELVGVKASKEGFGKEGRWLWSIERQPKERQPNTVDLAYLGETPENTVLFDDEHPKERQADSVGGLWHDETGMGPYREGL